MKAFTQDGTDEPEGCPEGHRNDDPELNAPASVTSAEEAEADQRLINNQAWDRGLRASVS